MLKNKPLLQAIPRPARSKRSRGMGGCVFLFILAAIAFIGSGWACVNAREKVATWSEADGIVVALEAQRRSSGRHGGSRTSYRPRFTFTAADGRSHTVTSGVGSNPPAYHPGERVKVLYPAEEPGEALIHSFMGLYLLPTILGVAGVGMALAGSFQWLKKRAES